MYRVVRFYFLFGAYCHSAVTVRVWFGLFEATSFPGFLIFARTLHKKHGRTRRKNLGGGRKEICPTFSDCALVVKNNFPEKLSKIVVDGGEE